MRPWLVALLLPLLAVVACTGDDGGEWWADPPEGMRWVGYDGSVVAVPDWWTTGEVGQGGQPLEDTVYFGSGVVDGTVAPDGSAIVPDVSWLAVSAGPEFVVTIADEGDGDKEEILDSERELPDGVATVPLEVDDWTPGWGALPAAARALVKEIEAAGLEADVEILDPDPNGDVADLPEGSLLDVEPALGTPIEEGGTVRVTVMGTSGP